MTVFENVCKAMLAYDSLLMEKHRDSIEKIANAALTNLDDLRTGMGEFFRHADRTSLGVDVGQLGLPDTGLNNASDNDNLSDAEIRKIQVIAKFSLALESVTTDLLQSLALV